MDDTKQSLTPDGSIVGYGMEKLTQQEANYSPFGFTDQEGCASCKWFAGYENRCLVVDGIIVPTGKSDLFRPLFPQDQMNELLEDFTEDLAEMGEVMETMEMGEAAATSKKHKRTLIDRLLRRNPKDTKEANDKPLFDTPYGFKVIGDNLWMAHYTNPYLDRDGEHFAEKSLDDDIAFMQETGNYPSLWRFHIGTYPTNESTKHGKAFAVTKAGRFVIAFGEFDDTPLGHAMKSYYKENPDQGVSHGFYYDPALKINGVYTKHHSFEISTLPPDLASNEYASFGVKEGTKDMATASDKQLADLKAVLSGRLPEEELQKVLQAAAMKSAELDKHVSHKSQDETPDDTKEKSDQPELSADTQAILGAFDGLKSALATMSGEIAGLKAAMEDDMMEDDEDEDGSKPKKKKEDKAQRPTAQKLSPEVTAMLRGLVEEKGMNEDAKEIDSRELDPASFVITKMLGGK